MHPTKLDDFSFEGKYSGFGHGSKAVIDVKILSSNQSKKISLTVPDKK